MNYRNIDTTLCTQPFLKNSETHSALDQLLQNQILNMKRFPMTIGPIKKKFEVFSFASDFCGDLSVLDKKSMQ